MITFHFLGFVRFSLSINPLTITWQSDHPKSHIPEKNPRIFKVGLRVWCRHCLSFHFILSLSWVLPGQVSKSCWPSCMRFSEVGREQPALGWSLCCHLLSCSCCSQYILASRFAACNEMLYLDKQKTFLCVLQNMEHCKNHVSPHWWLFRSRKTVFHVILDFY